MKIPNSILRLLLRYAWRHDPYDLNQFHDLLQHHARADRRDGMTCSYLLPRRRVFDFDLAIDTKDFAAIQRDGAIRDEFYARGRGGKCSINQHWYHSLCQFLADCTDAWRRHVERTDALIGTPAGTIREQ